MKRIHSFLVLASCIFSSCLSAQADDESHPLISKSSGEFQESARNVEQFLSSKDFDDNMRVRGLGATSNVDIKKFVENINRATPINGVQTGSADKYDVILQPGHYGRSTGRTGTGGRFVSEQHLAAYVASRTAEVLRKSGKKVLIVSADQYRKDDPGTPSYDGLSARIFISFHADGSTKPCTTGPSLAYSSNSSTYAMHAVGWGLARALGYEYGEFRRDGFTADSANYYMFNRVRASDLAGLLEMGELTCPKTEQALIANATAIAENTAHALNFVLDVPYQTKPR